MATQLTLNDGSLNSAGALAIKTNGTTQAINITTGQQVEFNDGSASAPSITNTGDGNTGVFFPDADTVGISTGGTERARVDSSGNLGLGVTPSAWNSNMRGFQLGPTAALAGRTDAQVTYLTNNMYFGASTQEKYTATGPISAYAQANGAHYWYYAASGSANANASLTQAMTLDASGNFMVGGTSANGRARFVAAASTDCVMNLETSTNNYASGLTLNALNSNGAIYNFINSKYGSTEMWYVGGNGADSTLVFKTGGSERARIDSSGNLLVNNTTNDQWYTTTNAGITLQSGNFIAVARSGGSPLIANRLTSDGDVIEIRQAGTTEGTISVSGTTVSYNGGHLSRYAQTIGSKDESLKKGTVLSNLDEMNTYTNAEGNPVENEQLNKVKVSDVEGDANVAGVFVNWSHDEDHNVDEINMAMTGDMIIRIAQGTTVARGDLLMSAGDGTAKAQGDDIVRAKTIAKVTSTHVTCTYEDGSYCVPCVLMAC
jgi:hypothetical protein